MSDVLVDLSKSCATQVVFDNGWRQVRDVVCTCSHTRKVAHDAQIGNCPECDVRKYRNAQLRYSGGDAELTDCLFQIISKGDTHFHIARQGFRLSASKERILVTPTDVGELSFHMRDKKFYITRNGKKITSTDASINTFFKGALDAEILDTLSTPHNRNLFWFCFQTLGCLGYERNNMWGRGLRRLIEYPMVEVFGLSSLSNSLSAMWHNGLRQNLKSQEVLPPHKALGLPRFAIKYMADMSRISNSSLERLRKLTNHFDGNSVKVIFEIFKDESDVSVIDNVIDYLIELHSEFSYKDVKRTVLYITREVKLEQGINSPSESAALLRDFARMSQTMQTEHDKFPRSLKKDHDIALMNYKAMESEYKQIEFAKVIESEEYASLEYKSKEFSIINPTHVKEVISEGDSLSHCVASYVDDIIKKKCKILFLRKTDSLDTSLITVEVRGEVIRQIRGRFNRSPVESEIAFVNLWAKKKDLVVQKY